MPRMDFQSGTIALVALLVLFSVLSVRGGLRAIQSARKMTFFHLRRQREARGWRLLGLAVLLVGIAVALPIYGLPVAYEYFPPSPTATFTPTKTKFATITVTPSITSTPTITDTALVTETPTASPTPFIPPAIQAIFQSAITPNPNTVFSQLSFSTEISNSQAVSPSTVFQNPVGHMYATFSYDQMQPGAQYTDLWMHDGNLVNMHTYPWDGGTGGYGITDWNPTPDEWLPGVYEVQIFIGLDWKVVGRFLVQGTPPTALPSLTPTSTKQPTSTLTPSLTLTPSRTSPPSLSPTPSRTPTPSAIPKKTSTP